MELKIWVDGIKRVVCGVTDITTCQDIVIALAQALGRTGRFMLIEQWRNSERPLAPSECPLHALQKWGEFGSEVKLLLYESGTVNKHKHAENDKFVPRTPDRFTHNFTPPLTTSEAVMRRSLTFHGDGNPDINTIKRPEQQHFENVKQSEQVLGGIDKYGFSNFSFPLQEHVSRDGNSWPGSTMQQQKQQPEEQQQRIPSAFPEHVLVSQDSQQPSSLPAFYHSNQRACFNVANPRHNLYDSVHAQHASIPNNQYLCQNQRQHSNNFISQLSSNVPTANGPWKPSVPRLVNSPITSYFSALELVQPELSNPDCMHSETKTASHSGIPMYKKIHSTSNKKAPIKEYDLNSNFPHVKETSTEYLEQQYNVLDSQDQGHNNCRNGRSWEEEERVKLLRLVTMQNKRIQMQDSQLEIIDTELSGRYQKFEDLELELSHVTEELAKMLKHCKEQMEEIVKLDDGSLIQEMEMEKQNERDIKNGISSLKTRLEKCRNDLKQFSFKAKKCKEDMDLEDEVLKTDEKRRKEEEIKLQTQVSELIKVLDERFKDSEAQAKLFDMTEEDLKAANDKISQNSIDMISLENELQAENLEFCHAPHNTETSLKSGKINGEAFFQDLEGSVSQNMKQNKVLSSPLTVLDMTKKNGVWV